MPWNIPASTFCIFNHIVRFCTLSFPCIPGIYISLTSFLFQSWLNYWFPCVYLAVLSRFCFSAFLFSGGAFLLCIWVFPLGDLTSCRLGLRLLNNLSQFPHIGLDIYSWRFDIRFLCVCFSIVLVLYYSERKKKKPPFFCVEIHFCTLYIHYLIV